MKLFVRIVTLIVFVVFFGFALKNTEEVALQFFLDYELRGPLVLLLLGFFAVGAALGVLAMMPTVLRYRRDVARQKKMVATLERQKQEQELFSQPDAPETMLYIDRAM